MYLKTYSTFKFLINDIKWELLIIAIICILIGEFDDNLYLLDEFDLSIPSFIGTVLVISLAFRTNKAYARWWEAKDIWAEIANSTRAWNRVILTYLDAEYSKELTNKQIAWTYILAYTLRNNAIPKDILNIFSPSERERMEKHDNRNQIILLFQSGQLMKLFREDRLPDFIHLKLERILRQLESSMGRAERIKKTKFQPAYDLLIHFCVYLFAIVSAYFIDDDITIFEASVSFLVTSLFLSFHHISRQIQDPFENTPSGTPMLWICHKLKRELTDITEGNTEIEHNHRFKNHII